MTVRPNSQNARILRALAQSAPGWVTLAEIHRRAGNAIVHSRISDLRNHGYDIDHDTIPGRKGALGSKYRINNPPSQTELARLVNPVFEETLPRKEIPRDKLNRYRIYRMKNDELDLVATATTEADVGRAICTLAREGEFLATCVGIMDTHGKDPPGEWILNPWETWIPDQPEVEA